MPEKEQKETLIKLDEQQFKDLLTAIVYVVDEQKNIVDRLTKIEGELKLIRIKMKEEK